MAHGSGRDDELQREGCFFAPSDAARRGRQRRDPLPWRRLVMRVGVLLITLVAVDALLAVGMAPSSSYLRSYRLPRRAPTSALAEYTLAIETAAPDATAPVVAFIGASPTFGHRIRSAAHTFPHAYASSAARAGSPVLAFNLGMNGAALGDEYLLARRFADDADIIFIQLTYHTFSPSRPRLVRYPELPGILGSSVSQADSALLGLEVSDGRTPAPVSAAGRWLSTRWRLLRQRDLIDQRLFGGPPRTALAQAVGRAVDRRGSDPATFTVLPGEEDDGFAAFDALDPGARMVVVARYAEESSFTVRAGDPQMRTLDRLASYLASRNVRAVFFMGPMNWDVIEDYDLIDEDQYHDNVSAIERVVARHGYGLVTHDEPGSRLDGALFADISHTTDEGGEAFGALLFDDSHALLEAVGQ